MPKTKDERLYTSMTDDTGVTFDWADGSHDTVPLAALPTHIQSRLAAHGLLRKLRDSFAGADVPLAHAKSQFRATLDKLQAGEWVAGREPKERMKETPIDLLIRAVCLVREAEGTPLDPKVADKTIRELSRSQRAALRAIPEVSYQISLLAEQGKKVSIANVLGI